MMLEHRVARTNGSAGRVFGKMSHDYVIDSMIPLYSPLRFHAVLSMRGEPRAS